MAVSEDDVRLLFKTSNLLSNYNTQDIEVFINDAELLVSEDLSGKGLTSDRLDLITKFLAAHFIVVSAESGGLRRSRVGDADDSYVVPEAKAGLSSTRFGQQAINLDTSGTFAQAAVAGSMNRAQFRVV